MDILLVDDDGQSLLGLGRFLRSEGHRVEGHPDPAGAVDACGQQVFQLIVADYRLPGMDGLELIRTVRDRQPGIKSILYSGLHSGDTLRQARQEGVDAVLGKPLYIQELLATIQSLSLPVRGDGQARLRISGTECDLAP